jgi:hypothetical protein
MMCVIDTGDKSQQNKGITDEYLVPPRAVLIIVYPTVPAKDMAGAVKICLS